MNNTYVFSVLLLCIHFTNSVDICNGLCNCESSTADCTEKNISQSIEFLTIPGYISTVDLSRNMITSLDILNQSESLEDLDLSVNLLEELQDYSFVKFNSTLTNLHLQNNLISSIHNNTFASLGQLKKLVLSFNKITFLPDHLFDDLIRLEFLDLNYNPIQTISGSTLKNVQNLKKLDLSFLDLTTINPNVFDWNLTITHLDLSYNSMVSVPSKALWYLRKTLRNLKFSGNFLETLPAGSFFGLENLHDLKLERILSLKKIEAFAFKNLRNLETIQLKFLPQIYEINPKAFRLEEDANETSLCPIRDLSIEFTTLPGLPFDLLNWNQMRYMRLANNRWLCDCHFKWIISSHVMNLTGDTVYCSAPSKFDGRRVRSLHNEDFLCVYIDMDSNSGIVALIMIIVLAMLISFATVITLVYRRNGWIFSPPRMKYDKVDSPLNTITIYDRSAVATGSRERAKAPREMVYIHDP